MVVQLPPAQPANVPGAPGGMKRAKSQVCECVVRALGGRLPALCCAGDGGAFPAAAVSMTACSRRMLLPLRRRWMGRQGRMACLTPPRLLARSSSTRSSSTYSSSMRSSHCSSTTSSLGHQRPQRRPQQRLRSSSSGSCSSRSPLLRLLAAQPWQQPPLEHQAQQGCRGPPLRPPRCSSRRRGRRCRRRRLGAALLRRCS